MSKYTFSYGETPGDIIRKEAREQCPNGYPMTLRSQSEWTVLARAVNQGIDSHLEALTQRSRFDAITGECNIHPEELHVLLRRFYEDGDEEAMMLRKDILETLGIEEL